MMLCHKFYFTLLYFTLAAISLNCTIKGTLTGMILRPDPSGSSDHTNEEDEDCISIEEELING